MALYELRLYKRLDWDMIDGAGTVNTTPLDDHARMPRCKQSIDLGDAGNLFSTQSMNSQVWIPVLI